AVVRRFSGQRAGFVQRRARFAGRAQGADTHQRELATRLFGELKWAARLALDYAERQQRNLLCLVGRRFVNQQIKTSDEGKQIVDRPLPRARDDGGCVVGLALGGQREDQQAGGLACVGRCAVRTVVGR